MDKLDAILGIVDAEVVTTPTVVQQAAAIIDAETVAVQPAEPDDTLAPEPQTNLILSGAPVDAQEAALNTDMDHVRTNMKTLIAQGQSALQGIIELAESGDQPRAYEVVGTMLTAIVNANKELINIHKVRKDAQKADKEAKAVDNSPASSIKIEQAVFVGRAQDLIRSLKDVEKQVRELETDAA